MRRRITVLLAAAALVSGCGVERPSRETAGQGVPAPADADDAETSPPAGEPDEPVSDEPPDVPGPARPAPGGSDGASVRGSTGAAGGGSRPNEGIAVGEPDPGASSCPECTPRPAPDEDRLTQPRPGQANVRARRWESAAVHDDDVTIDITYWSGVEPCYVLDRVEVREEAARVVITLYEGSQPGFEGACTEQAVERTTRIRLSSPLRSRALVDGSDPA